MRSNHYSLNDFPEQALGLNLGFELQLQHGQILRQTLLRKTSTMAHIVTTSGMFF